MIQELWFRLFPGNQWIHLFPFIIELFGDWWLIEHGKKNISSWIRVILVLLFGLVIPGEYTKHLILATIPFSFFDPFLNLLRGKPILYTGKTKMYDLFLAKFPPWIVLVGRFIFAGVLLLIYFNL